MREVVDFLSSPEDHHHLENRQNMMSSSSLDDLLAIDSHLLFEGDSPPTAVHDDVTLGPGDSMGWGGVGSSDEKMTSLFSDMDFDPDFLQQSGLRPDLLSMDLLDYASTHSSSSDSGKHSPSGSESQSSEQFSPWSFPSSEPSCSSSQNHHSMTGSVPQMHSNQYSSMDQASDTSFPYGSPNQAMYQLDSSPQFPTRLPDSPGAGAHAPQTPSGGFCGGGQSFHFSGPTTTITSQPPQPYNQYQHQPMVAPTAARQLNPAPKQVIYMVQAPSSTNGHQQKLHTHSGIPSFSPAMVKAEPPPPTPLPIFISQATGAELKPIPVLHSSKTALIQPLKQQLIKYVTADPEEQEYQRKQEDRKMKNRAAAQASRIKKKYEMDEMMAKVSKLEQENSRLLAENCHLKERLRNYENSTNNNGAGMGWPGVPSRKRAAMAGACVMAVFMMVSIMPVDIYSARPSAHRISPAPFSALDPNATKHGRVLVLDSEAVVVPTGYPILMNASISCGNKKAWMNKTETIRLNTDLYDWVDRHEKMDDNAARMGKRVLLRNGGNRAWPAGTKVARVNVTAEVSSKRPVSEKREDARQRAIRDRAWRHLDMISQTAGDTLRDQHDRVDRPRLSPSSSTASSVPPSRADYDQLAANIQQRPDTLYVVTMKDYFLLPAMERNATSRPRLTLILPALSFNGTLAENEQVPMMRIDLDVVGTGLFNLSRKFIPLFFN